MNLLNHVQTVFYALLKAQLVLFPLLVYHRYLVIHKQMAIRFLWQMQKAVLLFFILLALFFLSPLELPGYLPAKTKAGNGLELKTQAAVTELAFRDNGTVPVTPASREDNQLTMNIAAVIRVSVNILLCLSLCGIAWFILRLFRQSRIERSLEKHAWKIRTLKKVRIIYSGGITTAFTSGMFTKRIFLPVENARDRFTHKAVLAHEINHIRQCDLVWLFLECLLFHCFWYSWFARELMFCGIRLRELRCDQATANGFKTNTYLQILLESKVKQQALANPGLLASSWINRHGEDFFAKRVKYLLTAGSKPGRMTKAILVCLTACCLVLILGATNTPDLDQTGARVQPEQTQPAIQPTGALPAESPVHPPFTLDLKEAAELGQLALEQFAAVPLPWPCLGGKGKVSAGFGLRNHPLRNELYFHTGVDIAWTKGTPVLAVAEGTVTETGYKPEGVGHFVLISHGNGFSSFYGQLNAVLVKAGDVIRRGDIIGKLGSSGISTGPHLHLEIRYQDKPLDPLPLLQAGGNIK